MKKLISVILVLIIIFLGYSGHQMKEREEKNINYVASKINENVLDLGRYAGSLKGDFINQASLDRVYVHIEMLVNQIDQDIDTLKFMDPELDITLDEMIYHYVHLMDKMTYGIDRFRAVELMDELNVYIQLYAECGIFSMENSYETLMLRDEFINKKISELGSEKYRNMCLEIMSVK